MLLLKVCGMQNSTNITELIKVHPDFIGFIFHENSPRNIVEFPKIEISDTINKVGVFVNEDEEFIIQKVTDFNLDYTQLHGNETPQFCEKLKTKEYKIIKAFNIHSEFDFSKLDEYTPYCDYFLFDAFGKEAGGNGIAFNWELLDNYKGETSFLLSGGIDETMVAEIKKIDHQNFAGIDINSGFEIEAGIKDINKIKQFSDGLRS